MIEGDLEKPKFPASLTSIVLEQYPYLATSGNGCTTLGDNNYSYMGGCYIKGSTTDNYIWYSGFLWRIMGINADGTVRLIIDENVTTIPWGIEDTAEDWDESHAKDWLNDYFYSRLKGNDIITNQTWCSETTMELSSSRTTCTNNLSTEAAKVGLITLDEYNLAGGLRSYLNIAQWQWTMTPYNSSDAWLVGRNSNDYNFHVSSVNGLKAVINVNSDVTITSGNGTWSNPYKI